jgi:hypothetical protein
MIDQANYPSLDHQPTYQSYNPVFYLPSQTLPTPVCKNDLKQPLIESRTKKSLIWIKRKLPRILGIICVVIELSFLYYIFFHSYLFEYCYWKFGLFRYKKSVHKDLPTGNHKGKIRKMYRNLNCDTLDSTPFPECPDICQFAYDLKENYFGVLGLLGIGEFFITLLAFIYVSSFFTKKFKKNRSTVALFALGSMAWFLGALLFYVFSNGLLELSEPDEDAVTFDDDSEPNEFELEDGGAYLLGLLIFMVVYRLALVVLAK